MRAGATSGSRQPRTSFCHHSRCQVQALRRREATPEKRIWRTSTAQAHATAAQAGLTATTCKWDHAPVTVVGAGIAGLATAVALHRVGIPARVLEASPNLRQEGTAIGLWDNAWRALEALGVADALRPKYLTLDRVELCRGEAGGRLLRSFAFDECEGGAGSEFRGVHRAALLQALADALPPDTITFSAALDAIVEGGGGGTAAQRPSVMAKLSGGGGLVECGVLVGADGARSATARHLGLPEPNYAGYYAYRGVARLGPDGLAAVGLPRNVIRQIWGAGQRAGLYPLSDNELYWFVTFNSDAADRPRTAPAAMLAHARSLMQGWGWSMETLIDATPPEAVSCSRLVDRWDPAPWGRGLVTLVGDAAHPMTPNLGQGGCTALEDAVVLAAELASASSSSPSPSSLEAALRRYERARAARCVPLTVRSHVMGALLQVDLPPVCLARDTLVSSPLFAPVVSHFLDHCRFDVRASLPPATPAALVR